jgi:two-component system probable response regulator PhcQ
VCKILILDDEENNVSAISRLLRTEPDFHVEGYTSASEALRRAEEVAFDVVVSDYRMPEMDGTQFLEKFRERQPNAYRIIVSAYSDVGMLKKAINQAQIHRLIQKPWDGFMLVEAIRRGAEQSEMAKELRQLRQRVEEQAETIRTLQQRLEQANSLPAR